MVSNFDKTICMLLKIPERCLTLSLFLVQIARSVWVKSSTTLSSLRAIRKSWGVNREPNHQGTEGQSVSGANREQKKTKGRIPRNTKELAVAILRKEHDKGEEFGTVEMDRIIRAGASPSDTFGTWKKVVESKFDGMWSAAVKDAERQKSLGAEKVKGKSKAARTSQDNDDEVFEPAESSSSTGYSTAMEYPAESSSAAGLGATVEEDPKDLRTCSATLKQLVRPDLVEFIPQIQSIIEGRQKAVTDDITQVSIMAHKVTLAVSYEPQKQLSIVDVASRLVYVLIS